MNDKRFRIIMSAVVAVGSLTSAALVAYTFLFGFVVYYVVYRPASAAGTTSAHAGNDVLIGYIDIYCHESSMFLRTFDHPDGVALSNVLCGGTGVGEIRVYRKRLRTKTLELMESVRISNAICEFGSDKKL